MIDIVDVAGPADRVVVFTSPITVVPMLATRAAIVILKRLAGPLSLVPEISRWTVALDVLLARISAAIPVKTVRANLVNKFALTI